jgi:hypothetical protein
LAQGVADGHIDGQRARIPEAPYGAAQRPSAHDFVVKDKRATAFWRQWRLSSRQFLVDGEAFNGKQFGKCGAVRHPSKVRTNDSVNGRRKSFCVGGPQLNGWQLQRFPPQRLDRRCAVQIKKRYAPRRQCRQLAALGSYATPLVRPAAFAVGHGDIGLSGAKFTYGLGAVGNFNGPLGRQIVPPASCPKNWPRKNWLRRHRYGKIPSVELFAQQCGAVDVYAKSLWMQVSDGEDRC